MAGIVIIDGSIVTRSGSILTGGDTDCLGCPARQAYTCGDDPAEPLDIWAPLNLATEGAIFKTEDVCATWGPAECPPADTILLTEAEIAALEGFDDCEECADGDNTPMTCCGGCGGANCCWSSRARVIAKASVLICTYQLDGCGGLLLVREGRRIVGNATFTGNPICIGPEKNLTRENPVGGFSQAPGDGGAGPCQTWGQGPSTTPFTPNYLAATPAWSICGDLFIGGHIFTQNATCRGADLNQNIACDVNKQITFKSGFVRVVNNFGCHCDGGECVPVEEEI